MPRVSKLDGGVLYHLDDVQMNSRVSERIQQVLNSAL